jgi:predicted RNase H-like HicB family nuclease
MVRSRSTLSGSSPRISLAAVCHPRKTYEEAARNVQDAIAGLIEVLQNNGQSLPEPGAGMGDPISERAVADVA